MEIMMITLYLLIILIILWLCEVFITCQPLNDKHNFYSPKDFSFKSIDFYYSTQCYMCVSTAIIIQACVVNSSSNVRQ